MKYEPGTRLTHTESAIAGMVVPNFKLPGDVCVAWANGLTTSYDPDFLAQISTVDGEPDANQH